MISVSKEPHSGPAPPQLLNKSEAEKHHKTNDCSFPSSFIVMLTMSPHSHTPGQGNTRAAKAIKFRLAALCGVNRFTFGTWPPWYFLGMRGLTILFVTFAALLVMRGQQQPHFALRPTVPMPAVNVP